MSKPKVVLFGGYGIFGSRIAADLLKHTDCYVVIAGRNATKAQAACAQLGPRTTPMVCNLHDPEAVSETVRGASKVHYIDLTDARSYWHQVESRRAAIQSAGITALGEARSPAAR
jgi:saccharopine dehydrogenase-like NADP-dependent oxidoreductase